MLIKNLSKKLVKYRFITAAAIAAAVIIIWLINETLIPTPTLKAQSQKISIPKDSTVSEIASDLKESGVVKNATIFKYYVISRGWAKSIQAGDYRVPKGASMLSIARFLATGEYSASDISVFIPEGSNIWEVDQRLADSGLISPGQFAKKYYLKEGYLFPDTYRFNYDSTLEQIEEKMESNFKDHVTVLTGILSEQALNKIITTASLLEKEARKESDMQLVSGVIQNRLAIKMPLAIDAAVAYGACLTKSQVSNPKTVTSKNCDVTQIGVAAAIRVDTPFNTYLHAGLPPRPISNPGMQAISAALKPTGDYLFYLSTRDGSKMIFAHTAPEHAANRYKYLGL